MTDFGIETIRLRIAKGDHLDVPLVGSNTMINLSLGLLSSTVLYSRGGFSPSSLFANNEPGGWYDPSDLTTLFQDAAGTTPVTAVEQPVGLVLDKSKGGRQSLAVTGWVKNSGDGTVTVDGNTITITGATTVTRVDINLPGWAVGDYADMTVISTINGATGAALYLGGGYIHNVVSGTSTYRNVISASVLLRLQISTGSATFVVTSRGYVPGSHLSQSTSTARPVLSARVNALTYTEDFSNAAWVKGAGATATASVLSAVAGTGNHWVYRNNAPTGTQTFLVEAKAGTTSWIALGQGHTGAAYNTFFNLSNGTRGTVADGHTASIIDVGDGWYLCSVTLNFTTTNASIAITNADNVAVGWNAVGTETISIRKADLRFANAGVGLPAYQRVGAATSGTSSAAGNADYDTTGFPLYLRFDGTDDFLVSGTITPGSVDKAQVFAGVRKLSDAATGTIAEYSANLNSNAGAVAIFAPLNAGTPSYGGASRGSVNPGFYGTATSFASPVTNVVTLLGDISGDRTFLRCNGSVDATGTDDQGTGNYLSYPLYIGRRGGTTLPANMQLYSLILRFSATNLDAATIASTETWVNGKTRAF